jgi:hypothetical protein
MCILKTVELIYAYFIHMAGTAGKKLKYRLTVFNTLLKGASSPFMM